eukprot:8831541-Ditylum_brightwellii.AAC.1
MVKWSMIKNFPVTVEDIENANNTFKVNAMLLKGKTIRKIQDQVTMDYVSVPTEIIKIHKNVNLDINVLYVNK